MIVPLSNDHDKLDLESKSRPQSSKIICRKSSLLKREQGRQRSAPLATAQLARAPWVGARCSAGAPLERVLDGSALLVRPGGLWGSSAPAPPPPPPPFCRPSAAQQAIRSTATTIFTAVARVAPRGCPGYLRCVWQRRLYFVVPAPFPRSSTWGLLGARARRPAKGAPRSVQVYSFYVFAMLIALHRHVFRAPRTAPLSI